MMTIHDHIAELRAELDGGILTRADRRAIEAELVQALACAAEMRSASSIKEAAA